MDYDKFKTKTGNKVILIKWRKAAVNIVPGRKITGKLWLEKNKSIE